MKRRDKKHVIYLHCTIMTLSFVWFKYSINELCAGPTIVMSSIFRSSLKVLMNGGLVGRVKLAIKHPEYAEIVVIRRKPRLLYQSNFD